MTGISLTVPDYAILVLYFLALLGFGFLFRGQNKNTKDYFAGSGSMLWWLVGATAFMNMLSAFVFTGGSNQAYTAGFQVAVLMLGNAIGYTLNSFFIGNKIRQSAVVTPVELIRRRYGKVNEQVFTWLRFPVTLLQAGTWLSSLGIFMSSIFGWPPATAVMICGVIVVIMTLIGGSWAVIASDFLQMSIMMTLSIVIALVVLVQFGGFGNVVSSFNVHKPTVDWLTASYSSKKLFALWAILTMVRNCFSVNNMYDSFRYLCAADTKSARNAARLSAVLMVIGAFAWYLPGWAASSIFQHSQLVEMFPGLKSAADAAYLVIVDKYMPIGVTGLLVAVVFAATMSSMDSALNTNSGIFIRSFYLPIIKKGVAEESQLLKLSKFTTVIFGACIVGVAIFMISLTHLTIFDIILRISALVMVPAWIPLCFGFFIKKVPDWAAWATVCVGFFVSYNSGAWMKMVLEATGWQLMPGELKDLTTTFATTCHLCITLPFFLCSRFFYKETGSERDKERDELFKAFATPIVRDKDDAELAKSYYFQRQVLGRVSLVSGAVIAILSFMPGGDMSARVILFIGSLGLMLVGFLLRRSREKKANTAT